MNKVNEVEVPASVSTEGLLPCPTWRSSKAREAIHEAAEGIANCYCDEDDTFFPEVTRLTTAISKVVDQTQVPASVSTQRADETSDSVAGLLPCPFCGGEMERCIPEPDALIHHKDRESTCHLNRSLARLWCSGKTWNTRVNSQAEAIPTAFAVLKAALQSDPEYAWSWHCNVAMMFVDAGGDHHVGNQGAARFMKLCFDVDTTKCAGWQALYKVPVCEIKFCDTCFVAGLHDLVEGEWVCREERHKPSTARTETQYPN